MMMREQPFLLWKDILKAESGEILEINPVLNYDSKVWCYTPHKSSQMVRMQMRAADVQV